MKKLKRILSIIMLIGGSAIVFGGILLLVSSCSTETDKYADYLKVMNTLYSEELLHPDHYTMDKAEKRALMSERMNLVCGDSAPYSFDSEGWETYISAVPSA